MAKIETIDAETGEVIDATPAQVATLPPGLYTLRAVDARGNTRIVLDQCDIGCERPSGRDLGKTRQQEWRHGLPDNLSALRFVNGVGDDRRDLRSLDFVFNGNRIGDQYTSRTQLPLRGEECRNLFRRVAADM